MPRPGALTPSADQVQEPPEIVRRKGKTFKVVYLNRLPWDRLCAAVRWLQDNRPQHFAWLRDPGTCRLIREFQCEVPLEFEVRAKR